MAKEKYDEEDGVWRTVGGRRIFIKNGQSLSEAMKASGKFKTHKQETYEKVKKGKEGLAKSYSDDELKREIDNYKKTGEDPDRQKELEKELSNRNNERDKELKQKYDDAGKLTYMNQETGQRELVPTRKEYEDQMKFEDRSMYADDSYDSFIDSLEDSGELTSEQADAFRAEKDHKGVSDLTKRLQKDDGKEKKYNIEGIADISEDQLREVYNWETVEGNTNLSYEDWKKDSLSDPRSALHSIDKESEAKEKKIAEEKSKSEGPFDKDEDGGVLRSTAVEAYNDGDITLRELADGYFNGDMAKAKQAASDYNAVQDGGTLRDSAMTAYLNGDIGYKELVNDYYGGDEKKVRETIHALETKQGSYYEKENHEVKKEKSSVDDYLNRDQSKDKLTTGKTTEKDKLYGGTPKSEARTAAEKSYDSKTQTAKTLGKELRDKNRPVGLKDAKSYMDLDSSSFVVNYRNASGYASGYMTNPGDKGDGISVSGSQLNNLEKYLQENGYERKKSGYSEYVYTWEKPKNSKSKDLGRQMIDNSKGRKSDTASKLSKKFANAPKEIQSQASGIQQALGRKVSDSFETDLYGMGKADRFTLNGGGYIEHTKQIGDQKKDSWSYSTGGMNGEEKTFKSYDDMIDYLSKNSGAYKKAFEDYKKKHPNTKMTLQKFIDTSEGK